MKFDLDLMANCIRSLSMDAVEKAKSGHPGMPMGMADVATVLFSKHLRFDPDHALWPDRDRFVLSAGHGSMLLYSLLHLTGYPDMTMDELINFRQLGAKTAGHPEYGHATGIETTTGPLGQGLANAVGMALAEKHLEARFGPDLVNHHVYVIAGDGCLMEGISQEAVSFAGHHKLKKLIVLFDDNQITIDGPTSISTSEDQIKRFEASGWQTMSIDGHNMNAIDDAITKARTSSKPVLIACKTTIGKHAPNKAGKASTHGAPLGESEIEAARASMGWSHPPFEIPQEAYAMWQQTAARGQEARKAWQARLEADANGKAFYNAISGSLPEDLDQKVNTFKSELVSKAEKVATRKASQNALELLTAEIPDLIGGSADLTGSNNTNTKSTKPFSLDNPAGRHIHWGVREHGMMAAINGMALHKGMIPYGGTFLVFSDYARPALRLAALMGLRIIFVGTHDSIGLGEDGPTHQPVEHLAALRAIPNLHVYRPADSVETLECWQAALHAETTPSVIALTRQGLPAVRLEESSENLCEKGAYVIKQAAGSRDATILASGSEVQIALEAQTELEMRGLNCAVVSVPCFEKFDQQDPAYRNQVLGYAPRVAVEAGVAFGWTKYLRDEEDFVGMEGFGASAPAGKLFDHFGINAQAVVERVLNLTGQDTED